MIPMAPGFFRPIGDDPLAANYILYLKGQGTDEQQEPFIDSSVENRTVILANVSTTVKHDTGQIKIGTSSLYFPGTGSVNYIKSDDKTDVWFDATDDHTIEAWIYVDGTLSADMNLVCIDQGNSYHAGHDFYISSTGKLGMQYAKASNKQSVTGYTTTSSGLIAGNAWHHVAVSKYGTDILLFTDGTLRNTIAESDTPVGPETFLSDKRAMVIGAYGNGSGPFKGWMTLVRITQGVAKYTTTFTPPTTFS